MNRFVVRLEHRSAVLTNEASPGVLSVAGSARSRNQMGQEAFETEVLMPWVERTVHQHLEHQTKNGVVAMK